MTTKTKNVQDFSPAATRIYQAARTGVTNRTNSSHVKRIIDKELDKHFLSKEKIKKEISDATATAIGSEVKKAERFFYNQIEEAGNKIEELKKQVVDLTKNLEDKEELQEKISILESEKKSLIDEVKYLVEDKNVLIAQITDMKKADTPSIPDQSSDQRAKSDDPPPAGSPLPEETPPDLNKVPVEDTPPDAKKGPDQKKTVIGPPLDQRETVTGLPLDQRETVTGLPLDQREKPDESKKK